MHISEMIRIKMGKAQHEALIWVDIDVSEAEPEVGFCESFEITGLELLAYGGYKIEGIDPEAERRFEEGIHDLISRDYELYADVVRLAEDQAMIY